MLKVSVLGTRIAADDATGEVRTRSSRGLALVAFLALRQGSPQPRGRVAAEFWPESTDAQALTNLRRELHQLRRVLDDDDSLVVTATDLTWRDCPTCRVDLLEHQIARDRALSCPEGDLEGVLEYGEAALASYGGELLPGLYDDWVLTARSELAEQVRHLCAVVADAARRTGHWTEAIAAARRRIALDPFDEAGYRELMRMHAERGDRATAVTTYHQCASLLERELGLEPDPETTRMLDELLAPSRPAQKPADAAVVIASAAASPGFVGRRRELARLIGVLEQPGSGVGSILVTGEPGVGKTRLVHELARHARQSGFAVAYARCYGATDRSALAPVADWLADPTLARSSQTLAPAWRAELERLVPDRDDVRPGGPRGLVDSWQRHQFFQGLFEALRSTGGPTLLLLEDLHWCDEETLDLISFVLGQETGPPVLLALSARTRELSSSPVHAAWIRRTRGSGRLLEDVELSPLGPGESAELLRELGHQVPPTVASTLHSATGGFPLYLVEAAHREDDLARLASDSPDLAGVLRNRFDRLSPTSGQIAGLAAAIGRDFDLELLCEASDLPPDEVVKAVDELWRLRIIREHRRGYDYSHDLLRDAAYQQLTPPTRWLLHRRLAQALEILHAGRTDEVSGQLADQYSRAGNTARAVEHYHRAGQVSAGVFAHRDAIRYYRAALTRLPQLPPGRDRDRAEIRTLTAMAASLNAHRGYADPDLASTLERMVELAQQLSLKTELCDALVGLWSSRFVQGDIPRAHALATQALAASEATRGTDHDLTGQAHFAIGGSGLTLGMPGAAVRYFEVGSEQGDDRHFMPTGGHPAIHARAWSAHAYFLLGQPERAAECAREAISRARLAAHPYSLAIALAYAAVTWQLLDDREQLIGATDELAELSTRHGFAYYGEWGALLSGWVQHDDAGTARMQRALANLRSIGAFCRMPYWLSLLATRVNESDTRAMLDAAVVSARSRRDVWWLPEVLRQRAALLPGDQIRPGLLEALELARAQGSVALAERCERDLVDRRTLTERRSS